MKRLLALLLSVLMLISFTACSEEIYNGIVDELIDEIADSGDYYYDWEYDEPEEWEEPDIPKEQEEPDISEEQEEQEAPPDVADEEESEGEVLLDEHGTYSSKDDVALYIHQYGKLPENFIKKKDAQKLGWKGGKLENYAPGKCIGGDWFGNYEKVLPEKKGRDYYECDIDTLGKSGRGSKRIVYSDDGLIYYSDDHYESFTLLYGEE